MRTAQSHLLMCVHVYKDWGTKLQLVDGNHVRFIARNGQLVWLARVANLEGSHIVWGF